MTFWTITACGCHKSPKINSESGKVTMWDTLGKVQCWAAQYT